MKKSIIIITIFIFCILIFNIKSQNNKNIKPKTNIQNNNVKKIVKINNTSSNYGTMKDQDGNIYKTIKIGNQIWMAENLKVTHFRNGDEIPYVIDDREWDKQWHQQEAAYCSYNNDEKYAKIYGYLYNWHAVNDNRKIAPEGWHVPTDAEWETLSNNLGGSKIAGGKMKETSFAHWKSPNTAATNSSGFKGLPGGNRDGYGYFVFIREYGNYWSATEVDENGANFYVLDCTNARLDLAYNSRSYGYSVRLIMD